MLFVTALILFDLTGCATSILKQTIPSGNRIIWVKDFDSIEPVKINQAQRRNISDKIALLLDSYYSNKFSAIYRQRPPNPEKSIIVSGVISGFGPSSSSGGNPDALSTWMQQFGAGKLAMEITVADAATGEKLINRAQISYPIYENADYFGWTRIDQTVNVAAEKIARSIGKLKIKDL
jgi:hypothetical protein